MSLICVLLTALQLACHKPVASSAVDAQSAEHGPLLATQGLNQAERPSKEALLAAGFCAEDGNIANITELGCQKQS